MSVGLPWMETPLVTNQIIHSANRWEPLIGPSWGQYGVHVIEGIYFHSVPCDEPNPYNVPPEEYYKLGSPASHGCIRVTVATAKWIYQNCNGCPVTIFDGAYVEDDARKGPLGKPPIVPMTGNFDPTDTFV